MNLNKLQKDFLEKTEQLLNRNGLIENEQFAEFINEIFHTKTKSKNARLLLQLKNDNNIVKELKKIGWKINHKYYTNGQVSCYADGDSKDNYGNTEMIQLFYE